MVDLSNVRRPLEQLYGMEAAAGLMSQIEAILRKHAGAGDRRSVRPLSQSDAFLITYPDMLREPDKAPLKSLAEFAATYLDQVVSGIHILPFYPSSSDDGFSVMDYRSVDPAYGTWDDIRGLGKRFDLMFDAVINHASAQGAWFRAFLRDEEPYNRYFLTVSGSPDLSAVVRPRTLPLLTEFNTAAGKRKVWTTFSADQVDLDFSNPRVLLEILDVLLSYVEHDASWIRLDAIAYAWKDIGTNCIHRPRVHALVQLIRAVLQRCAPHVRLITETNVPHADNMRYLGDGQDEAQLVYNFTLPPLLLQTFRSGQSNTFREWASSIDWPATGKALFNVLATHDGIGLNGLRGIIPESEIEQLAEDMARGAGQISRKSNPDGTASAYEINVNYLDALDQTGTYVSGDLKVARFLTAHAIMSALKGVPAVYFHSLFGSRGWMEGVRQTGQARSVNRQKLDRRALEQELRDSNSVRAQIFAGMARLLRARQRSRAFAPDEEQVFPPAGDGIVAILRSSASGSDAVLCAHNITSVKQTLPGSSLKGWDLMEDMLAPGPMRLAPAGEVPLEPFQSAWLRLKR